MRVRKQLKEHSKNTSLLSLKRLLMSFKELGEFLLLLLEPLEVALPLLLEPPEVAGGSRPRGGYPLYIYNLYATKGSNISKGFPNIS